ncbi:DNA-binding response OmpR family regulator [Silvibacterium bohemicum]|uniref:DNA-binding response OmpR family regulator n=2 Tax=Silvibacterium bohemicum TaxID=1577686 RepID=A0A841KA90_9BACT|nr:response regulator transcription factor [Silvibacterium bohemicum]MBB6147214.1 DNA-binding response OmpR family regulator [Silvibacterium bohemicum]
MRFLIADDDRSLATLLVRTLNSDGHSVRLAADGLAALESFVDQLPDFTILDLDLPRKDGVEVLRAMRTITYDTPILILTARSDMETRIKCLDFGADDYLLKPFSIAELRARCRALLRRRRDPNLILRQKDLEVNRVERSVRRDGQPVVLTNKEFALLEYLLLNRGQPVSRSTLLEHVWDMRIASTNVVDVYVNYLRRKLGDGGDVPLIQTVRGEGYAIGFRN